MAFIRNTIQVFIYILAGSTIGSAIFLTLFNPDSQLTYVFLWQIIILSAVCAMGNFIFISGKVLSRKQVKIRYIIHYLYNGLVVTTGSQLFNWIGQDQIQTLILLFLFFTLYYIIITMALTNRDKKIAEVLNQKLKKYHEEED
jgi:uncharacterized membrane protein YfcA